jgi:AhpC/TSA family
MRSYTLALGAFLLSTGCRDGAALSYRPRPDSEPRQIFPNLTLEGVRSKATMATPETISTSEYYDPTGARYDLLHVVALFMWCPHCNNETNDLASIAAWQAAHRVAVVQIAMEGYDYGSASPSWTEVQKWVGDHNLGFPLLVDGQGAELGKYFPVNSVPVNIAVNPRTMEVLDVQVGEVGSTQSYEQGLLNSL